jgi:hypothetical protein
MEKISIAETSKTPAINLDLSKGLIEIKGRSIPENSTEFYMPLLNCLKNFLPKKNGGVLTVNFQLEYFNTSSSKCILEILKSLTALQKTGIQVTINWYYEEDDDDMQASGENYQEITNISFNMIPVYS